MDKNPGGRSVFSTFEESIAIVFAQIMVFSQILQKCTQGLKLILRVRVTGCVFSRGFYSFHDFTLQSMKGTWLEYRAVCNPGPNGIQHNGLKILGIKDRRKPRFDRGVNRIQSRIFRQEGTFLSAVRQLYRGETQVRPKRFRG